MRRDTRLTSLEYGSSFESHGKDIETILRKLFITSQPYSDKLKRLLVVNTKDCLNNDSDQVLEVLKETSLSSLVRDEYIKLAPKIRRGEHEEVKSYIIMSTDNYTANVTNTQYRDCTISFDIISYIDYWNLEDYRLRPLAIAGVIDGILNRARLSGIGTLEFMGCNELILNEELAGYTLTYRAVHGNDDKLTPIED